MAKLFVWRPEVLGDIIYAIYDDANVPMPTRDDAGCIWRGGDVREAVRIRDEANAAVREREAARKAARRTRSSITPMAEQGRLL